MWRAEKSVLIFSPDGQTMLIDAGWPASPVVKPGDTIPLTGAEVRVLSADGKTIEKPAAGGGAPNPECAKYPWQARIERDVEDNLCVGMLFTFGKFRLLELADLEALAVWNLI